MKKEMIIILDEAAELTQGVPGPSGEWGHRPDYDTNP